MASPHRDVRTWLRVVAGPLVAALVSMTVALRAGLPGPPALVWIAAVGIAAACGIGAAWLLGTFRGLERPVGSEPREAERFRALMRTSVDGIWRLDAEGRITEVSAPMAAMLGVKPQDMAGRHFLDFTPADERDRAIDLFRRSMAGETLQVDFRLDRPDGTSLRTIVSSQPLLDARGRFLGAIGIVRDVTSRHESERERTQALSLLEATLDSTADGLLVVDAEGRIVRFNARFARMWRIPPSVLATHDDAKAIGFVLAQLEQPDQFQSKIRQLYADPEAESFDTLRFKDGRVFERYSIPQRQGGAIVGRVWSFRDVTDRVRAEAAIRLALEREATIAQNIDAALFTLVLGPDRRVERYEHFSNGAHALYGVGADVLEDDPGFWLRRVHPGDQEEIVLPALERLSRMQKTVIEFRYQSSKGIWRWHRSRLTPRPGADGLIRVDGLEIDVTDRVALEEQLRHAQKMEAVGQLAGGVAHDFNNILTAILGYADLMLERMPKQDSSRPYVEEVRKGGERAAALIRQLLSFSRRAATQPRIVDLNAALRDLAPMVTRLVGENIAIQLDLSEGAASVRIDPSQLEQVIVNLVVNARDAMPQGGAIRLTTEERVLLEPADEEAEALPPGCYIRLSVSDTGVGIAPEAIDRIFEPFYTTKGPGQGTGLGLATVYGIARQNHGRIRVESEVGRGTTFEVLLPRVDGTAPERPRSLDVRGGSETILYVEDDAGLLTLGREILAELGYTVLTAPCGAEALEVARHTTGPIHLLLTDVVMPRMGGRALARRLLEAHPSMGVLFLSGYTPDTVLLHGVEEARIPFLAKPYSPLALAAKVREVLDAPRSGLPSDSAAARG